MNDRRRVLMATASALALSLSAPGVRTQTGAGKRRLAWLSIRPVGAANAQFTSGLRELGWIEGSNLTLDRRWTLGDAGRVAPLTRELLAVQPDALVIAVDFMAEAAAAATKTVPIVFVVGTDPVARGLVKSLARPGGNVTGFATLSGELFPKCLQLMKEAVPGIRKIGAFVGSRDRIGLEALEDARGKLGLEFVPAVIDLPDDVDAAFDKFAAANVKGVMDFAAGAGASFVALERIAALAIQHRMAMLGLSTAGDSGALLSYGVNILALFKRAAALVDRILRGAKPADIPVEQINVYELVVNLRTARALGIELPRSLLLQATRVIE